MFDEPGGSDRLQLKCRELSRCLDPWPTLHEPQKTPRYRRAMPILKCPKARGFD